MELRSKTNAGMMDCKKALLETNGDMEAAAIWLREKGISKASKIADRIAAEGLIFTAIAEDEKTAAILEFNSETDFVAKNNEFINFGNKLAEIILNNNPLSIEDLKKIEMNEMKIEDSLNALIATIGENMNIRRFQRFESDSFVTAYLHMGGQIGVIVRLSGSPSDENKIKAKDIAMHVAAMAPDFLDKSEVTEDIIANEKSILRAQLLEEGKPEKIIDNILIGKMNKFYEDNCLLQQKFVKDDKITVSQYLGDLKIDSFVRYKLGEGLEKKSEDFAAEVAAQIK
jgi:elongation factor Ts